MPYNTAQTRHTMSDVDRPYFLQGSSFRRQYRRYGLASMVCDLMFVADMPAARVKRRDMALVTSASDRQTVLLQLG